MFLYLPNQYAIIKLIQHASVYLEIVTSVYVNYILNVVSEGAPLRPVSHDDMVRSSLRPLFSSKSLDYIAD